MTGIDKICDKIINDAQAQADAIDKRAQQEAAEILNGYTELAKAETESIISRGEKNAAERKERLGGVARLEARKLHLKTKQQMIDNAFSLALDNLRHLPEDEYIRVLASLAAKSSISGDEQVILNTADRAAYGKQVVAEANRILKSNEETPADANALVKLGKQLIGRIIGGLTLSDETRDISGGVILKQDKMEINATFDTLIRLSRDELSGEIADILFS